MCIEGRKRRQGCPPKNAATCARFAPCNKKARKTPESIVELEGWHRTNYGGSLRAAVFGANDGLVSNFSLVMGIAGANAQPRFILLAGIAGLLAGASSMAAGEYVSVQSQRELYEQQIAIEREELEMSPDEEREELSLIYQAKGVPKQEAEELASALFRIRKPQSTRSLARSLDYPAALGNPWLAAGSSFIAFAIGAVIPVIPYLLTTGATAFMASTLVCAMSLFVVGGLISLFTGRSFLFSGFRMLGIGALAAGVTYLIGKLLGITVSG